MTHGLRILKRGLSVSPELIARAKTVPVANVSDCMSRMTAGGPSLRPMHGGGAMAGAAFTVKTRPGDNLMIHKALLMLSPGDVLVVDGGGDLTNSLVGELMLSYAIAKGATGVVINGSVRDSAWIARGSFPVFAAGVSHRGPYKDGPGEINVPISLGGMVIHPGDLVIGDDDGLLSVPREDADAILDAAQKKNAAEAKTLEDIEAGRLDPKTWVDDTLRRLGCDGI